MVKSLHISQYPYIRLRSKGKTDVIVLAKSFKGYFRDAITNLPFNGC